MTQNQVTAENATPEIKMLIDEKMEEVNANRNVREALMREFEDFRQHTRIVEAIVQSQDYRFGDRDRGQRGNR